jgi:hypothetical protein
MTDIGLQHLLHTLFDGIFRLGSDELAALGGDLLDLGVLGSASKKSDFGNVITLTDNSGEFSLKIGKKRIGSTLSDFRPKRYSINNAPSFQI